MRPMVSVIVPVYNANQYLQRFIDSLLAQTLKNFEVICIDDASTDGTSTLLDDLAARNPRIRVLKMPENCGAGAARNKGIAAVCGETICFADPDDFLPPTSLEVRYAAYKKHNAVVRACHAEIADNGSLIRQETPPEGMNELCNPTEAATNLGVNPFLCAHWTWLIPASMLKNFPIFNEENTRTAEDIMFLARLFFHITRFIWIPDTVYYWIKRPGSLSHTVYTAQHYADYFRCCHIFYEQAGQSHLALADSFCNDYAATYLIHLYRQFCEGKSSEEDVRLTVHSAAKLCSRHKVFERLGAKEGRIPLHYSGLYLLWQTLNNGAASAGMRLGNGCTAVSARQQKLFFTRICQQGWDKNIKFDKLDKEQGLLRARWLFCNHAPEERFALDGKPLAPAFAKNRFVSHINKATIYERILWLPVTLNSVGIFTLTVGEIDSGLNHTGAELYAAFAPESPDNRAVPPDIRILREAARTSATRERFKDAWIFIDKDTEADDNAEHLYRYVMQNHPEINAWFVLNKNSHDWPRLEAEGFKLVAHGSHAHTLLYLNAKNLVSSQMDEYIFKRVDEAFFSDFSKPKFICLPHGVTKDDVSDWFNTIPFDLFIAATPMEAASIAENGSPYIMGEKEVRLGGFPRYDRWLEPVDQENIIFVMPTWRADLVGAWDGKGQNRAINPNFFTSPYVKTWQDFFEAPALQLLLEQSDFRAIFFAHPCVEPYLHRLPFPSFVEKRSKQQGSIIPIIQRSRIMITDFSSVAFDMAYMHRPVLYYQQESKDEFVMHQRWKSGYINYESMGFGPVCKTQQDLINALKKVLNQNCTVEKKYLERIKQTFPYHDNQCCQRAFSFISQDHRNKGMR